MKSFAWPIYVSLACSAVAVLATVLALPAITGDLAAVELQVHLQVQQAKVTPVWW